MKNNKIKILICDDSQSMRSIVHGFLSERAQDFELVQASNGLEAEEIIQEAVITGEEIDVIILDWMMPKVSGKELLERIRSIPAFENMPKIVMLTAETYPEQVEACMKFGVSAYLTKPFTQDDLLKATGKALDDLEELKHAV